MKIINNTNSVLFINDIGVTVPLSKMGSIILKDSDFNESKDILDLIKSNSISVITSFAEIGAFCGENLEKFCLSGTVLWEGNGATKASVKLENYSVIKNLMLEKKKYASQLKKRYKLERKTNCNISLESVGLILSNQNSSCVVSEEIFNKTDIQRSISSGLIYVKEILHAVTDELGRIEWVKFEPEENQNLPLIVMDKDPEYKGVDCIWEGPIFDAGGYANMNRQFVINLTQMGANVRPVLVNTSNDIEEDLKNEITKLSTKNVRPRCPKIYATNIPGKHNGFTVSFTMMETEGKIHKNLVKHLNAADEIWVPSQWNKDVFENSGIKKNIKLMPLAVDEKKYFPSEPRIGWNFPTKGFIFLSVSTWLWRKGYDVLLKAYSRAFSSDDDVSLIIFTHIPGIVPSEFVNRIKKEVSEMAIGKPIDKLPNFSIVTSFLPTNIAPLIYSSADCFVLFSRGEGWGLPYCEAIASGLPIVGADHGGQQMFLNNENSFLVKPDKIVKCHPSLLHMTPFYEGMNFVSYSEKAIDEAAEKMRYVYENKRKAVEIASKCRDNLLEKYTWRKSATNVASRLRDL